MPSKFGGIPVEEHNAGGSKFGGVPVADETPIGTGPQESHPIGDFVGNFTKTINPIPGLVGLATHPIDTVSGMVKAQGQQFGKAYDDLHNTKEMPNLSDRLLSAAGHTAAGIVPLVGPAAADAGEQIGSGDVAGGLGKAAGLMASLAVPEAAKGIGKGIKAPAAPIVEHALGVRNAGAYGATPGEAALQFTSGIRPSSIAKSAGKVIGEKSNQVEDLARNSNIQPSLVPARNVIDSASAKAAAANSTDVPAGLVPMREQLTKPGPGFAGRTVQQPAPLVPKASPVLGPNGQPTTTLVPGTAPPPEIAPNQPALQFLEMKRQFGKDHASFRPGETRPNEIRGTANQAYRAMGNELDQIPGVSTLDQQIQSLIPIRNRANAVDLNEGALQKSLGRIARPTGALTGAALGFSKAGIPGALVGLGAPELISAPAAQMAAARTLYNTGNAIASPVTGNAARIAALSKTREKEQK